METMASESSFQSNLWRVKSSSLDSQKHWYILTKAICGTRPNDFAKSEIFRRFPDEIQRRSAREVLPAKSAFPPNFNRMPSTLYVVSTFGLFAGLVRQKDIPADSLISSQAFKSVLNILNSMPLDLEPDDSKDFGFGGKFINPDYAALNAELKKRDALIDSLELQLQSLQAQIGDLEADLEKSFDSTCSSKSVSSSCSSPESCSSSIPSSECSSIEDTRNSPDFGSTTKKRKVLSKCRKVMASLSDVSGKYEESIACVLGNSFIFGGDDEKGQVRDTISEVVDIVIEAKGKKGFTELLSSETHARVFHSMRVPDWVLLYFKLQAKLPDRAWQTLLNFSQLGKSGVSDC